MANQFITTEQGAADLADVVARLVEEAVAAERERCAQIATRKAEDVARVNTYRGKVNSASVHAIGMLEDVAAAIRAQGSKT